MVLPIIKNLTTVTDESGKCLSSLQGFVSEFKAIAHDHGLVLFECYWSELVMCLHHVIDLCILSSSKRLAQEVCCSLFCGVTEFFPSQLEDFELVTMLQTDTHE